MRILLAISVPAFALVACSGQSEPGEKVETVGQAVTATPFFYLRCNATDWGVDEGSRLLPTSDSNTLTKTIQIAGATNDPCSLTETVATAPDEWGNSQTFFVTPGSARLPVPGSQSLVAVSPQGVFNVSYPSAGSYTATFRAATFTLSIAPTITSSATQISAPGEITAPGNYVVVADLTSSGQTLTIHDTHDVNLDCGGHSLTTTGAIGGLVVQNVQRVTVTNCTTLNAGPPGTLFATQLANVSQGTFSGNTLTAVNVNDCTGLTLNGNTIHFTYQQFGTTGSLIENNTFIGDPTQVEAGLVVTVGGSSNRIINNTMDGQWNGVRGVELGADDGIVLQNETNAVASGNTIHNTWDCGVEGVGILNSSKIDNNTISTEGFCCVGAFLATNMLGNEVAGNNCSDVNQMFDFTRSFPQAPGEGTIFFENNSFLNNTLHPGGLIQQASIDFVDVPAGTPLTLGNNRLAGNTFLGPTPNLLPALMFVDGGGNVCTQGTNPNFPLACGRP